MPHAQTLHECHQQLQQLFPHLSRPLHKSLAAFVSGTVESGSCTLSRAAANLPTATLVPSSERRFQRLLTNPGFAVTDCQQALSEQVLAGRHGRLDLLLDATTTGTTKQCSGTQSLVLALGQRGRALPLAWRCWQADAPGQDWGAAQTALFAQLEAVRPPDTAVVLMADRGLSGAPLVGRLQAHGWHYLLRVTCTTRLQLPAGQVVELGSLVPQPGTTCLLDGVKVYAPRRKAGPQRHSDWEQAVTSNVVAVWRAGDPEAWLLLTDLPATRRRCSEYRRRTWEEQLFRDLKSMGWGWQRSRVRQPVRVARLLVVLAVATLWMLALGQRVVRNGWRGQLESRARRCLSTFQLGRRWLARRRARDQPVHCYLHCYPIVAPSLKLS
jgi:hypothetical protein